MAAFLIWAQGQHAGSLVVRASFDQKQPSFKWPVGDNVRPPQSMTSPGTRIGMKKSFAAGGALVLQAPAFDHGERSASAFDGVACGKDRQGHGGCNSLVASSR